MGKIIEFSCLEELLGFLRKGLLRIYEEATSEHKTFHIALSGGTSIMPVLEMLKALELQWDKVHLYQVDERLVPIGSDESNQRLLRQDLCQWVKIPEENLHFVHALKDPEEAACKYEGVLKENLPSSGFDAIVLGLGKDCHIASLFPEGPWLEETDRLVVAVKKEGIAQARVSLTLKGLCLSKAIFLLVIGKEKRHALRMLLDEGIRPEACPGKYLLGKDQCLVLVSP